MASPGGNPVLIGAFVVGAVALAAVSVIAFGSGRMFEDRTEMVTYFPASVTGLDRGAPVIFQGVKIGEVTQIDALIESKTFEILVRVFFDAGEDAVMILGERTLQGEAALVKFVEMGLRAQLKSQSMITGKLYLDLARHPDTEIVLHNLDPDFIEIPSIPTSLAVLSKQLREAVDRFRALPLEQMVEDLAAAVAGLNELLNKPETEEAIDNLNDTLKRAESLLTRLDGRTDGLVDDMEETLQDIGLAAEAAQHSLEAIQANVEPGSGLSRELTETLIELQATLRSLRSLADEMSEQPEGVIFGRPKEEAE